MGCSSHYHYGSSTQSIKPVKTDIQTIRLTSLSGMNIGEYRWDFNKYLKKELKKRTYITLNPKSSNQLYIKAYISDIVTKRYRDKIFGVNQFHVDKFISMNGNFKIKDKNGRTIVSESYQIDSQNTEVTDHSFRATEMKHRREGSQDKLYEKLFKSLSRMVVGQIISERKVSEKKVR
jgi:hypothetical protein